MKKIPNAATGRGGDACVRRTPLFGRAPKQSQFLASAVVAACAVVFAAPVGAKTPVTSMGQPSFSLPIAVPPGLSHLTPSIGLSFAGDASNGPLGVGWKLSGLSSVTRCPSTKAVDGVPIGVAFTQGDQLCLDGQRLIITAANGTASDNQLNGAPRYGNSLQAVPFFRTVTVEGGMHLMS